MKNLLKVFGWVLLAAGAGWIAFVLVAVATRMPGFTTLPMLVPSFGFHIAFSLAGLEMIRAGKARGQAAEA